MRLDEYRERACGTDQKPIGNDDASSNPNRQEVIPLLDLVGEVRS